MGIRRRKSKRRRRTWFQRDMGTPAKRVASELAASMYNTVRHRPQTDTRHQQVTGGENVVQESESWARARAATGRRVCRQGFHSGVAEMRPGRTPASTARRSKSRVDWKATKRQKGF